MLRTPEPGTFEKHLRTVDVPTAWLHRLSRSSSTEPYWGKSARGRFDDPLPDVEHRFGVLYCAEDLPTAFAESVIHESQAHADGAFEVSQAALASRELVIFGHPRRSDLTVVDLTGAALKALGLNNDICSSDDYTVSQQWARAIHEVTSADGIFYVSRQNNRKCCLAIFERSGLERASAAPLSEDDITALCVLFNVRPMAAPRPEEPHSLPPPSPLRRAYAKRTRLE